MEHGDLVCGDRAVDWRVFLLPSARLGYSHQPHHGGVRLPVCRLVIAGDRVSRMAAVAPDAVRHVVDRGRLLRTVLAFSEPGCFGPDARCQLARVIGAVWDVRAGLVGGPVEGHSLAPRLHLKFLC